MLSNIFRALEFAAHAHSGQIRGGSPDEPYINHCIRVARTVRYYCEKQDHVIMAALLHDVVEDTHHTWQDIYDEFGPGVAALVADLTDTYTKQAFPEMNRRERKDAEIARLGDCCRDVRIVKCADLIDNSASIIAHNPSFAKVYVPEKERTLEAIGHDLPKNLVAIAERQIREYNASLGD